ncbi:MAG: hypothetical protein EHM46_02420 [Bacteroidetes bacterium]|nr:MAG: hypothetical protein EHM46_02420 [Bacteroidota bacterium]
MDKLLRFILKAGVFSIALLPGGSLGAQTYFRMSAEFTVKIKRQDGTMNLTRGTVYYDKNIRELIYDVTFPRDEKWVVRDTSLMKFTGDTLADRISIPSVTEFTVFHLSLNAGLKDFGLKQSRFKVSQVEKKGDLVLSYWKMPKQVSEMIDFVVVAKKENRLESVIIMGQESRIVSRQFFRDYIQVDAFEFPGQIVQVLYDEQGNENYQVTEFSGIRVNDLENEERYHFRGGQL